MGAKTKQSQPKDDKDDKAKNKREQNFSTKWDKATIEAVQKQQPKPKTEKPKKSQEPKLTWYAPGQPYPLELVYSQGQDIIESVLYNIFDNFDYSSSPDGKNEIFKLKPIQVHETPPGIIYQNDSRLVGKDGKKFGSHACMLRCLQAMVEVKYQRAFSVEEIVGAYEALVGPTDDFAIKTNASTICDCRNPPEIVTHMLKLIGRSTGKVEEAAPRYWFETKCNFHIDLVNAAITLFRMKRDESNKKRMSLKSKKNPI